MSKGWMRVREAAHLMSVSDTTIRRRVESGSLRGRVGKSGRQEVFLPAQLRRELEAKCETPISPGHLERGKGQSAQADVLATPVTTASPGPAQPDAQAAPAPKNAAAAMQAITQTPGDDELPEDQIKRYERLAGGSLMLAQQRSEELQKHTDSAHEQLAHTRWQLRQVRKAAFAGWACAASAVVLGVVLAVAFGLSMTRAQAQAQASKDAATTAELRADNLTRDLASVTLQRDTAMQQVQTPRPTSPAATTPTQVGDRLIMPNGVVTRHDPNSTALVPGTSD